MQCFLIYKNWYKRLYIFEILTVYTRKTVHHIKKIIIPLDSTLKNLQETDFALSTWNFIKRSVKLVYLSIILEYTKCGFQRWF